MPTGFQIKKQELTAAALQAVEKFERETGLRVIELRPQHMKDEHGARAAQIGVETDPPLEL